MNNKKYTGRNLPEKKYKKNYYKTHSCTKIFTCSLCGTIIYPDGAGSRHRNHCPNCLASLHLDIAPGDRSSECKGIMEAVAIWVRNDGEWTVIHRCKKCGALHSNRIAADDNPLKLISIVLKPLSQPPFPIEMLEEITKIFYNQQKDKSDN